MSDPIVVTGIGLVTPIGVGIDAVWDAWVAGRSGIRALTEGDSRFVANVDPSPLPELARAGYVTGFTPREHVKTSYLRRMDWCSRMLVAAAHQALIDAGSEQLPEPSRAAIVVGSVFGGQREAAVYMKRVLENGPASGQPFLFPNLVLNAPAGYAAIELGIQGPNLSVSQHEASGEAAIATAVDLLEAGVCDLVIAGGVDEFGSVYLGALRDRRLLDPSVVANGKKYFSRGAVVPGEGAAAVVLERASRARDRGATARARIVAVGNGSARARAYSFPDPADAAAKTLALCSREQTASISGVIGGADGTKPRDAFDSALLEMLRERRHEPVGYAAVKRLVGDWGSAGALSVALGALSVERCLLPSVGNGDPAAHGVRNPDVVLIPGAARGGALLPVLVGRADPRS